MLDDPRQSLRLGSEPAFPCEDTLSRTLEEIRRAPQVGLTKRELFAAMAMQGILASDHPTAASVCDYAKLAVKHADDLLAELAK